jgi:1-deoxy-D-xylulose-5-phosphate reductoisomerase
LKRILLIGATGSIGRQTLDIVQRHPEHFCIVGMSAHRDEAGLLSSSKAHPGAILCLSGATPASHTIQHSGTIGLESLIETTPADILVNAAFGSDGLPVSLKALTSGLDLALANKESIVMAGRIVLETAARFGKSVMPVDSEHSAIWKLIKGIGRENVKSVIITASGGAFRSLPLENLPHVTPKDALAHPTWNMGAKITVDSASMANKGLEVIEAARLFSLQPQDIEVVIHPESRVHSFVRSKDGSLYAQISRPDMRIPILGALSWPQTLPENCADMDPTIDGMSFYKPDPGRFPLLELAYEALGLGEGATNAYNAANEIAVEAFLNHRLRFTEIPVVVSGTLKIKFPEVLEGISDVLRVDRSARNIAMRLVEEIR